MKFEALGILACQAHCKGVIQGHMVSLVLYIPSQCLPDVLHANAEAWLSCELQVHLPSLRALSLALIHIHDI